MLLILALSRGLSGVDLGKLSDSSAGGLPPPNHPNNPRRPLRWLYLRRRARALLILALSLALSGVVLGKVPESQAGGLPPPEPPQ